MKAARESKVEGRRRLRRAFTLIEIMIVVGIMGIILAMGIPPITRSLKREGMRKAVQDIKDACHNARARAIFKGYRFDVVFHPLERRFEIVGDSSSASTSAPASVTTSQADAPPVPSGQQGGGQIEDSITFEMLDINLLEYNESESARVRFFPNGTSDEMTIILVDDKGERRKITSEVTTGLTDDSVVK